jgi:hypothetical protein
MLTLYLHLKAYKTLEEDLDLGGNTPQEGSHLGTSDAPIDLSENKIPERVLKAVTVLPRRLDDLASFIEKDTKLMGHRERIRSQHRAMRAPIGSTTPDDTAMTSEKKRETSGNPAILAHTSRQLLYARF